MKNCPKCGTTNASAAAECSRCGVIFSKVRTTAAAQEEPPPYFPAQPSVENMEKEGDMTLLDFATALFDLSLSRMITPAYVQAINAAAVIVGAMAAIISMVMFLYNGLIGRALLAVVAYLVLIVLVRISAEFMIIAFKIEKNTSRD